MLNLTAQEKKALKGRGYIATRDGEHFVARVVTVDGTLTADELEVLTEAARRFGNGKVAMTTRLTVEVQGISYENIEPFAAFIAKAGLYAGGTGARVRPIVACKGSVCVHGLADTQALARELHEKFYKGWFDIALPHKFKIGIGGCPNNCIKPGLNDFGIMGQRVPQWDPADCCKCKSCSVVEGCPSKAAYLDENGVMQIDREKCRSCGKCIANCRFGRVKCEKEGFRIIVGGYWGKKQRLGDMIDEVYTKEEVIELIERALLLYREQGYVGERFGMYIERIGTENFVAQLKAGDVMARKEEILASPLHTR